MGQIRRKLDNYTIVLLHAEGSGQQLKLTDMAALRVRDGREADRIYSVSGSEENSPEKIIRKFRDFIGDDIVLTDDMDHVLPLMEELYRKLGDTFFTNTMIDLVPLYQEACRKENCAGELEAQGQRCLDEPDMEKKVRLMKNVYDDITEILFSYQDGLPYWVGSLTAPEERFMAAYMKERKRRAGRAYLSWCAGCHYFYLGRPLRNLVYLLTLGGLGIWALIDLYRIPYLVDDANQLLSRQGYRQCRAKMRNSGEAAEETEVKKRRKPKSRK